MVWCSQLFRGVNLLDKTAWIIGGSGVASAVAIGGLIYHVYTRNLEPEPAKPVKALSESQTPVTASKKSPANTPVKADARKQSAAKPSGSEPAAAKKAVQKSAKLEPKGRPAAAKPLTGVRPPAKKPERAKLPSFDIVRVEPSGDSIVAGRSEPGAEVELLNNGKPVAKAKADASGQFVMIPKALAPGAHQLQLRARNKDKVAASKQAVAVSVPKRGGKEVIVALAEPDKPTVILSDSGKLPAAAQKPVAGAQKATSAKPPATNAPAQAAAAKKPASTADAKDPARTPVSARPDIARPAAAGAKSGNEKPAASERASQPERKATAGPAKIASLPAPSPKAKPRAQQKPVRIRIVEAEQDGGFFVSGFSVAGSRIRLYLNRSFIAEVQASPKGTWSVRVARGMAAGNYAVRADLIDPAGNKVLSRAEVPFHYPASVAAKTQKPPVKLAAKPGAAAADSTQNQAAKRQTQAQRATTPQARQSRLAKQVTATGVEARKVDAKSGETKAADAKPAAAPTPVVSKQAIAKQAIAKQPSSLPPSKAATGETSPGQQKPSQRPDVASRRESPSSSPASVKSEQRKDASKPAARLSPSQTRVAVANGGSAKKPIAKEAAPSRAQARKLAASPADRRPATGSRDPSSKNTPAKRPAARPAEARPPVQAPAAAKSSDTKAAPQNAKVAPAVAASPGSKPARAASARATPRGPQTAKVAKLALPPPAPAAHVVIERLTTANVEKGDSLWRISRKILGRGIRYTQIYAANTDQIRNPHLIYPGQVFVVPLGKGQAEPAKNSGAGKN